MPNTIVLWPFDCYAIHKDELEGKGKNPLHLLIMPGLTHSCQRPRGRLLARQCLRPCNDSLGLNLLVLTTKKKLPSGFRHLRGRKKINKRL